MIALEPNLSSEEKKVPPAMLFCFKSVPRSALSRANLAYWHVQILMIGGEPALMEIGDPIPVVCTCLSIIDYPLPDLCSLWFSRQ